MWWECGEDARRRKGDVDQGAEDEGGMICSVLKLVYYIANMFLRLDVWKWKGEPENWRYDFTN